MMLGSTAHLLFTLKRGKMFQEAHAPLLLAWPATGSTVTARTGRLRSRQPLRRGTSFACPIPGAPAVTCTRHRAGRALPTARAFPHPPASPAAQATETPAPARLRLRSVAGGRDGECGGRGARLSAGEESEFCRGAGRRPLSAAGSELRRSFRAARVLARPPGARRLAGVLGAGQPWTRRRWSGTRCSSRGWQCSATTRAATRRPCFTTRWAGDGSRCRGDGRARRGGPPSRCPSRGGGRAEGSGLPPPQGPARGGLGRRFGVGPGRRVPR